MVKTLVLAGLGTNSHKETAYTASLAGSDRVDIIHFADIATGKINLLPYQFIIFPGGFMDGDDLGAAQAASIRWRYMKTGQQMPLLDNLYKFVANGGVILGICNGFQLLVKLGLLPGNEKNFFSRSVSLSQNNTAKFENRWVTLKINPSSNCIFTKNLSSLKLPIRHGEGRVIIKHEAIDFIVKNNLYALTYTNSFEEDEEQPYPANPNGSALDIAGLTDPTGRILGLMPHPEAFHHYSNHPSWTRGIGDAPGTLLFANAINHIRSNL